MKNIKQKIINEYNETTEYPSGEVWVKIERQINNDEASICSKKTRKFLLKPILAACMSALLIISAVAAAPMIFKLMGSRIEFFESDKQTRYADYQEIFEKYSSEVGITVEDNGFSFTIDNIAFDDNFLTVFYTVKSDENIFEWYKDGELSITDDYSAIQVWKIAFSLDYKLYNDENYQKPFDDIYSNAKNDAYFVSDYEIKGVQRLAILEDLPDVFDILLHPVAYQGRYAQVFSLEDISLTIDRSENKMKTVTVKPNINATIVSNGWKNDGTNQYPYVEGVTHNITIDKVSLSPLGNLLFFTEHSTDDKYAFSEYFIVDDKGRCYGKAHDYIYRLSPQGSKTVAVEFYGEVPSDAEYIKLIPFNRYYGEKANGKYNYVNISDLPRKVEYTNHGSITIESCDVTDREVSITYKQEGMAIDKDPSVVVHLGHENGLGIMESIGRYSYTTPIYNRTTDSYTIVCTFDEPMENPDYINKLGVWYSEIELLDDQAVIIPLS